MIISLTGGLGNQLFQYFAGLYFCSGPEKLFVTSDFGVPRRTGTIPDLELFSLHQTVETFTLSAPGRVAKKVANLALTRKLPGQENTMGRVRDELLDALLPFYFSAYLRKRVSAFSSDNVGYSSRTPNPNSVVFGYFQTYRYFYSLPQNKRELTLKNESTEFVKLKNRMIVEKPLVVHVRLGDYVYEKHFGVLSKDYYSRGIKLFEKECGEAKIWLFSDDPVRAFDMLPKQDSKKVFVVPNKVLNPAESLELMRYGSRYLIANSTFSWWGAMLSYSINPHVKAPSKWFNGMEDPHELIPENWELLTR